MTACILTGHGHFAEGMLDAFEMIAGPRKELVTVPFHESNAAEFPKSLAEATGEALERGRSAVIFCDLMGGTPFNQAMLISQSMKGVRVVAGTNLPMLLECLLRVDESADADALADQDIEVGRAGISAPQLGSLAEASEGDAEEGGI